MNQIEFESRHEAEWSRLARALDPPKKSAVEPALSAAGVPALFRRVAAELAIARDRQYRTSLLDRLHALVVAAHFAVHGARIRRRGGMIADVLGFFFANFPPRSGANGRSSRWPAPPSSFLSWAESSRSSGSPISPTTSSRPSSCSHVQAMYSRRSDALRRGT